MVTVVCGEEIGMVLIPAGEFNTGETKRIIYLDKFYIDKTEVTQKEFSKIMGPANFYFKGENHLAEQISWFKAKNIAKKSTRDYLVN